MQKTKLNFQGLFSVIKCCLLGIVFTLVGTVVLAVVLKFVDISSGIIDYINNAIKGLSIFFMLLCMRKVNNERLFSRSILAGLLYAGLSFVIFSALNGGFIFDLSIVSDVVFALIVSIISAVIINLFQKKSV